MMSNNMCSRQRVLIIGSSSSTGTELVHALSEEKASRRPIIFAFCKQTAKLDSTTRERCNRVIQGDYKQEDDIARALKKSKADTVIFAAKDKFSTVSFSISALEAVLERREYSNVRLISLSKDVSDESVSKPTPEAAQPQQHEQQLAPISRKGHKRKSTPIVLKDALEGLSEFWSAVQSITCSSPRPAYLDDGERSTMSSTFAKPWKKQRKNISPLFTKSLMDMADDASRDAPPSAAPTFDSDVSSPPSTPLHLKVSKKKFVEFVVGTVLERGSSSSISEARDILVTAE
ncbi:MAG: hypothetical protein SGARI_002271 [Bacillariaceae sp.]